jgi:hypothetical protein
VQELEIGTADQTLKVDVIEVPETLLEDPPQEVKPDVAEL